MAAAALPPRKNPTPTRMSTKQHLTPMQTLLQMGFPKHRAEKALASTGHRSAQLANDWLLAHVHDPLLDEAIPREYILYACPTGPFLKQLEVFWTKSKNLHGWNGAHSFLPHITLVSFFKAPDECAPQLSRALKQVIDMAGPHLSKPLSLELYTSENFMGFFVKDDDANYLKHVALQYVKEVSSSTISLEPHVKSLHLTLAYQFPSNQFAPLKALVESLDPSTACNWELRLYSREPRLSSKQVHNVLYPHTPLEPDELELRIGDYIYLCSEALENTSDGWVEGSSWLTGASGHLPAVYTERTAESDAWTVHKTVKICKSAVVDDDMDAVDSGGATAVDKNAESSSATVNGTATVSDDKTGTKAEIPLLLDIKAVEKLIRQSALYDLSTVMDDESKRRSPKNADTSADAANRNRQLYIMRHGERVDFTFGPWIPYCFDASAQYAPKDLNMPRWLPTRKNTPNAWERDSPLTNIGVHQASLTGQSLGDADVQIDYVYCSPSYRCIQTATGLLEGLGLKDKIKIRIEYGLFEWLIWYPDELPEWLTKDELTAANYNIDMDYVSMYSREQLKAANTENSHEFYKRNSSVVEQLLKTNDQGNVFIIGHAVTLETCSRLLCGLPERTTSEMTRVMQKVSYCSLVMVERVNNEWKLSEPPCYPLTHNKNSRFDWKVLSV